MSDIEPTTETIISSIKKAWSQSLDLRVSKVGNRMPETFMSSLQANQPPISDQWPELKCLMSLEWKESTILQLQKDSSLITKRFCTAIETDNLKIGFYIWDQIQIFHGMHIRPKKYIMLLQAVVGVFQGP